MAFTDRVKLIVLAIVHVFETSRPFGGYGSVAVLNDGAGVSYGVSQFTHRSGSLYKVVNTYLGMGGTVGEAVLRDRLHLLMDRGTQAVRTLAGDRQFKDALRFAAETDEMRQAQNQIAENFYLLPAVNACDGSNFVLPLSLAVVYDSINHGSWSKIRDEVDSTLPEKQWITEYVRRRHAWLRSSPKLKATSYRTSFFLDEIRDGNWDLDLPIYPHGVAITDEMFDDEIPVSTAAPSPFDAPAENPQSSQATATIDEPQVDAGQPPTQQINANTVVQTGDVAATPQTAEVSLAAPASNNSVAKSATLTIGGFAVPGFLVGIVTAIKSAIENGFINAADVGNAVLGFITSNTKYAFGLIGLVIVLLGVKHVTKHITLWFEMHSAARTDLNTVKVENSR